MRLPEPFAFSQNKSTGRIRTAGIQINEPICRWVNVPCPFILAGMISFAEFKKALGSKANSFSDMEIERMKDVQDKFADVIFDIWLKKRNQAKIIPPPPPLMLPEKSAIMHGK